MVERERKLSVFDGFYEHVKMMWAYEIEMAGLNAFVKIIEDNYSWKDSAEENVKKAGSIVFFTLREKQEIWNRMLELSEFITRGIKSKLYR